jgi:hypothetical protein
VHQEQEPAQVDLALVVLVQVLAAQERDLELVAPVQVELVAEQDLVHLLAEQRVQVAVLVQQVLARVQVLVQEQELDLAVVLQLLQDNSFQDIKKSCLTKQAFFMS